MEIKYPVRVNKFESDTEGIWWEIEDADGKGICELPEEDEDVANTIANAMNAIHEFPPNKLMGYMVHPGGDSFPKRLFFWYKKYITGELKDASYNYPKE